MAFVYLCSLRTAASSFGSLCDEVPPQKVPRRVGPRGDPIRALRKRGADREGCAALLPSWNIDQGTVFSSSEAPQNACVAGVRRIILAAPEGFVVSEVLITKIPAQALMNAYGEAALRNLKF